MSKYIDFSELKKTVSIEQAADFLGLELKQSQHQLRGACPTCNSGRERALAITPEKQLFYCFASETGGDCIKLVAHIKGIKQQEAAQELAEHFDRKVQATVPQRTESRKQPASTFDPEAFGKRLVYTNEVSALGINEEDAVRLGIGFHPQRKMVYLPIRNVDGSIAGFIGCQPGSQLKMPPQWLHQTNVVRLRRA